TIDDEFFVGDDLLVAPVTDAHGRDVYLPAGTWYDFWDEQPVTAGGATVSRPNVPLDRIPVFVRAGAILPLGSTSVAPPQYTAERPNDPLAVHSSAFPAGAPHTSTFDVYDDDGLTMSYEAGKLARTRFAFPQSATAVDLEVSVDAQGGFSPPN